MAAPKSRIILGRRVDELGTIVIDAALTLLHKGKNKILVGEIAAEVNRILSGRGERLSYSPEAVGQNLQKMGFLSRRQGGAGRPCVIAMVCFFADDVTAGISQSSEWSRSRG